MKAHKCLIFKKDLSITRSFVIMCTSFLLQFVLYSSSFVGIRKKRNTRSIPRCVTAKNGAIWARHIRYSNDSTGDVRMQFPAESLKIPALFYILMYIEVDWVRKSCGTCLTIETVGNGPCLQTTSFSCECSYWPY